MPKVKMHPLLILALFLNSIAISIYAYRGYSNLNIGQGITFTLLFILFIGVVILGIINNRKIERGNK
ncbi:hypothetical protein [Virgibacillus sp. CBA3643]|uniref:hypothetical protein n=1 Tax=Virgibacillus sp. CBA3643 TaxID=2942278 RepID=UPI0035A3CC1D